MPIHKTSLYDASLVLQGGDFLDLRGVTAVIGIDVNGEHSAGSITVNVDGVSGEGFSRGDKVVSGLTGRAVGIVDRPTVNGVDFKKGIKHTLVDNDTLELAPKYEIVGIMPLGTGTGGNLSTTNIDILIPSTTDYFGTLAPNGAAWVDHDDHITKFGAGAEIEGVLDTGLDLPSGTMFEGRWKKVSVSVGTAILYLKTATSQTF
jgi:hypothetical protein